ncbi:MAG: alpha/beta hydrolase family protein [Candidatus Binataceae bacterium]
MIGLKNPGLPSSVPFDTVVYASSGVNYSAVPALVQYNLYDTPDPAYVTGRINISAFAQVGSAPWPFSNTNVPLNGQICVPHGRGPFPLAVFAHGNHNPLENSTPGYLYLCQLLASHGIISATIDANFLNGFNFGENDARAIVHLEHLRQFRAWNGLATHPLHAKIDLNRILIVGHSRGGEGVGHASFFNRLAAIQPDIFSPVVPLDGSAGLGPYRLGLTAVAAIAPTDRQYQPISGPTVVPDRYFLIHGSRDGDVSTFEGYNTYNRAHAVDLANPTVSDGKLKALLWVYRANHNQFNSVWASETPPATTMPRAEQEQIAEVHFGALAQALLLDRSEYFNVLRDHAVAVTWVPAGADFVSQYQDPKRVFVQHNQESLAAPEISLPVQGTVAADFVVAARQLKDLVNAGSPQTTITLRLEWSGPGARLLLKVDPATLPAQRYRALSFRVGQSTEAKNAANRDQDFTIEVSSGSRTAAIAASTLHRLIYPDVVFGAGKIVMQTLRLPLKRLAEVGVDLTDLRSIAFVFDRRSTGVIYVGDAQVSN